MIKEIGQVYREVMGKHYPATSLLQVSALLESFFEFFDAQPSIFDYSSHGIGINRIISWDGYEMSIIRHNDVLSSLLGNPEA